jgi:diguanylate cyclase (GGDEF)-like protein
MGEAAGAVDFEPHCSVCDRSTSKARTMNDILDTETGLLADETGKMRRRPKLLVVDDQRLNVHILEQVFAADHQVFTATDGEQAIALATDKLPDLILLDVEMPGISGYETCQRLKVNAATRDVPVIFVTSHTDESAEARGLDVGAVDFITKPVNARIVRARVKTHLTLKAQSDTLRQWVYVDGLTGAYNRRHFDERLAVEWGRAVRNQSALSAILIDVDYFKRYNDRYGHQAGDECLHRVAATLKAGLRRPADLLARYGGEEFVCLLPDTGLAGALQVARHLGEAVFSQGIEHTDSSVAKVLTVSLGVCSKEADTKSTASALLRSADAQLYAAKASGRHRACGAVLKSA